MQDRILLEGLQVMAHVGVSLEERAQAQLLELEVTLHCNLQQSARAERISLTIDYAAVHEKIIQVVQLRPRPLIETVAEEVSEAILLHFPADQVEVTVRKFILPNTKSVAVKIMRDRTKK